MIKYTKNKQTGNFDVIGPANEMVAGAWVKVTKQNGETKNVLLESVSKSFTAKFGEHKGQTVAIGTVSQRRSSTRSYTGSGRCKGCGGPVVSASHHHAMGGYCGSCAFDEFDM